jgi:hypothetical protein
MSVDERWLQHDPVTMYAIEAAYANRVARGKGAHEGIRTFADKRPPNFTGA